MRDHPEKNIGVLFNREYPVGQSIHNAIFAHFPWIIYQLPVNDFVLGLMQYRSCRILLMSYVLANYKALYLKYGKQQAVHFNLPFLLDPEGHEFRRTQSK